MPCGFAFVFVLNRTFLLTVSCVTVVMREGPSCRGNQNNDLFVFTFSMPYVNGSLFLRNVVVYFFLLLGYFDASRLLQHFF